MAGKGKMAECNPTLLNLEFIFKYVVPTIIALATGIIGFFQFRLNKTQQEIIKLKNIIETEDHRFKFYEKRSRLFCRLENLLGSIKSNGGVHQEHIRIFNEEILPDQWLLPFSYSNYFCELKDKMKNNMLDNKRYTAAQNAEQKKSFIKKSRNSFDWIEKAKAELYEKFEPVLRIPNN